MCMHVKNRLLWFGVFWFGLFFEDFFFLKQICLWNRSLNSGNMKGVDVGWKFLAQSSMRFCNETKVERWTWGALTWQNIDLAKFPEVVQNGSAEFIPWAQGEETCAGERLKEGRAPAPGGDTSVCQAVTTALCNAIWQEQMMQTPFLCQYCSTTLQQLENLTPSNYSNL